MSYWRTLKIADGFAERLHCPRDGFWMCLKLDDFLSVWQESAGYLDVTTLRIV
ncbi:MAG: hypothetical protein V3R27_03325 [Pseudomonadales bacterium]